VREAVLRDEDLLGADEAFFTSTTRGVMPATRVDGHVIGAGTPGPVTRALRQACDRKALAAR
jgi:branched-subunit amino acid aminotransferase/4-amino-4-deoxychorismate lyase